MIDVEIKLRLLMTLMRLRVTNTGTWYLMTITYPSSVNHLLFIDLKPRTGCSPRHWVGCERDVQYQSICLTTARLLYFVIFEVFVLISRNIAHVIYLSIFNHRVLFLSQGSFMIEVLVCLIKYLSTSFAQRSSLPTNRIEVPT